MGRRQTDQRRDVLAGQQQGKGSIRAGVGGSIPRPSPLRGLPSWSTFKISLKPRLLLFDRNQHSKARGLCERWLGMPRPTIRRSSRRAGNELAYLRVGCRSDNSPWPQVRPAPNFQPRMIQQDHFKLAVLRHVRSRNRLNVPLRFFQIANGQVPAGQSFPCLVTLRNNQITEEHDARPRPPPSRQYTRGSELSGAVSRSLHWHGS
jgi:hypothetical protein